eukprot:s2243_g9.t5
MGPARGGSKAMAMRAAAADQSKVGLIESSASSASDPLALLDDLGEDVKVSAHSEIQLLRSLLANNKVDPDGFRERTQGVVSALFLTMDRYTEVVECDPEADWGLNPHLCNHIHPLLAGTATIFAVSSVVTSLILSTQIKFVPDEYLGDWMASLKWSAEFPLMLFILSIISWALDLSWRGVVHYGTFGMFFFGGMVAIPGVCIIIFYIRSKSLTNKYLLLSVEEAEPAECQMCVHQYLFPMYVVKVSDFLQMGGAPEPHHVLREKGLLHEWQPGSGRDLGGSGSTDFGGIS